MTEQTLIALAFFFLLEKAVLNQIFLRAAGGLAECPDDGAPIVHRLSS